MRASDDGWPPRQLSVCRNSHGPRSEGQYEEIYAAMNAGSELS